MPWRGSCSPIFGRIEASPVSRPAWNGALAASAPDQRQVRRAGRCRRRASGRRRRRRRGSAARTRAGGGRSSPYSASVRRVARRVVELAARGGERVHARGREPPDRPAAAAARSRRAVGERRDRVRRTRAGGERDLELRRRHLELEARGSPAGRRATSAARGSRSSVAGSSSISSSSSPTVSGAGASKAAHQLRGGGWGRAHGVGRGMRIARVPGVFRPCSDTWLLAGVLRDRPELPGGDALDVCTGSGALAIAAALGGARSVTAVDVSRRAVLAARLNARLNGVRVDARRGDLLAAVPGAPVRRDRVQPALPSRGGASAARAGPAHGGGRHRARPARSLDRRRAATTCGPAASCSSPTPRSTARTPRSSAWSAPGCGRRRQCAGTARWGRCSPPARRCSRRAGCSRPARTRRSSSSSPVRLAEVVDLLQAVDRRVEPDRRALSCSARNSE